MTKSEKIKAEIKRRMDLFQKEKDELPITTETRIARSILSARINMCVDLLVYINEMSDDKPQQLQSISVPFGNVVDNCAAKCWEPGGVCDNPHRDCIGCPKDWNLSFNTYTSNNIEGNLSANPEDCHITVKPKISEDTTWNANIKGACKLSVAPEVRCGEVCDHCISQPICDKPEKCKVKVVPLPEDAYRAATWTERDEDMLSDCISAVMAWYDVSDERHKEMVDWLKKRLGKNEEQ